MDGCPLNLPEWMPDCRNVISVKPGILWQRGRLEYLAFHEVCHIRQNDQYIWGQLDEKQRWKRHKVVESCVREIAGEERYWRMKARYHLWD